MNLEQIQEMPVTKKGFLFVPNKPSSEIIIPSQQELKQYGEGLEKNLEKLEEIKNGSFFKRYTDMLPKKNMFDIFSINNTYQDLKQNNTLNKLYLQGDFYN